MGNMLQLCLLIFFFTFLFDETCLPSMFLFTSLSIFVTHDYLYTNTSFFSVFPFFRFSVFPFFRFSVFPFFVFRFPFPFYVFPFPLMLMLMLMLIHIKKRNINVNVNVNVIFIVIFSLYVFSSFYPL